jgi:hypothetical protein
LNPRRFETCGVFFPYKRLRCPIKVCVQALKKRAEGRFILPPASHKPFQPRAIMLSVFSALIALNIGLFKK